MIKGVIFDCDGTLVDSEGLFNRALSIKLAERGVEIAADHLVMRFRGIKFANVISAIEQEHSLKLDDAFIADYRSLVENFFKDELRPCEGVIETLQKIDLPMSVATNGPLAKMKVALEVTGLAHFFNNRLCSAYEVDSWKPDPGLFLHAAKAMNLSAKECLVVEDSVVGIEAAIAADMPAVLYDPNGSCAAYYSDLTKSIRNGHIKARITKVSHFNELVDVLAKW